MKKTYFYLVLAFLVVGFNSCSKDDGVEADVASILGKWNLEKMYMKAHVIDDGEDFQMEMTAVPDGNDNYAIINADGTYEGNNTPMTANVVVTGSINMNYNVPISNTLPSSGTWKQEGNLITFQEPGEEPSTYEIKTLTASKLVLYADQDTAHFPLDDSDGVVSFSVEVTMRR